MVKGYCRTNLDEGKRYTWPTMFVAVPKIGERVSSQDRDSYTNLKVVGITHLMVKKYSDYGSFEDNGGKYDWEPQIEVELNK